jgi:hypothetical protein
MAENNIVLTGGPAPKLMLNGVEATAQQVYDAFMAGPVRLDLGPGSVSSVASLYWENSDGTKTNPKAVSYVSLGVVGVPDGSSTVDGVSISVGTKHIE